MRAAFSCFIIVIAFVATVCGESEVVACSNDNDCFFQSGKPNCVEVRPGRQYCSQCKSNADCKLAEYCVKHNVGKTRGTCISVYDDNIIGEKCVVLPPGTDPVFGVNDRMFCGNVQYDENGDFLGYEWAGACLGGICRVGAPGQVWIQEGNELVSGPDYLLIYPGREVLGEHIVWQESAYSAIVKFGREGAVVFSALCDFAMTCLLLVAVYALCRLVRHFSGSSSEASSSCPSCLSCLCPRGRRGRNSPYNISSSRRSAGDPAAISLTGQLSSPATAVSGRGGSGDDFSIDDDVESGDSKLA